MTRTQAVKKVLDIARGEIGYYEKASNSQLDDKTANIGHANYTKYARDLDAVGYFYNGPKQGYAYCDVSHDWFHVKAWGAKTAMKVLCQPEQSCGAGCSFSAQYYKDAGRWYKTPQPGDQIFFDYGGGIAHTGIVESVSTTSVTTIEGNTSDMVARRTYNLNNSSIAGYGRPRYELVCDEEDSTVDETERPTRIPNKYDLRLGDKNDYVKELQEKLMKLGYDLPKYGADSEFGNETLEALTKFQSVNGLVANGIADEKTWAKIEDLLVHTPQDSPANKDGFSDEEAIWRRLYSHLGNAFGVAGVMGNFKAESAMRSNNVENSYEQKLGMNDESYTKAVDDGTYGNFVYDSVGYGLYQATFWSIKQHLLDYAKRRRKSIGDRDIQVDAFVDLIKQSYQSVWQTLVNATSVLAASNAVLLNFERPADQSVNAQNQRASFGQEYYDKYANSKPNAEKEDKPSFGYVLRKGDSGARVMELQQKLMALGYGTPADFGDSVLTAVEKLQEDNDLLVDGEAGDETLWKIEELLAAKK